MHEYSIIASLVDRVEQVAATRPGAIIKKLHVRIGELAGVEVELLHTAFTTFRARTVCDRAELVIEPVAVAWRCARCGGPIEAGAVLRCCGRPAKLVAGDDIVLERVEMEVPDV